MRWTDDEEVRLRELVTEFGTRGQAWPVIAERLGTGRTHAAVEQHWQIMIGKRKRNGQSNLPARRPSLGSDDGAAAAAASISPRDQLEANRAAGPEPHQAKRARKGKLARVTLKVGADGTVGVRARATPVKAMPSAPPAAPGAPPKPPTACMLFVKERQAAHAAARTLNAETGVECTPTERYNLAMNEWKEAGRTPPAAAALAERKRTLEAQQKAARDEWRALQPAVPVVPVERGGGGDDDDGAAALAAAPRPLNAHVLFTRERISELQISRPSMTPPERYAQANAEWKAPPDEATAERKRQLEEQQAAARDEWKRHQPPRYLVGREDVLGRSTVNHGGAGRAAAAAAEAEDATQLHLTAENLEAAAAAADAVGERRRAPEPSHR